MTPERIQSLIAAGESLDVEFKGEERFPLSDDDLVEAGLVEERGQKKGRTWHLSAATYRRLGKPATSASAASSHFSRNRWCCNTWKSTGGSPGARRRNCAGWNVGRPADPWPSLHGMARLPCTGRKKGLGMAKVHKYDLGLTLYGCGHKIKPRAIRNCSRANNSNNNPTGMSANTLWTGTYIRTANSRLAWIFVPSVTAAAYGQEVDERIRRNLELLNGKIELRRRMSRTLEKMAPPAAQLRQQQAKAARLDAAACLRLPPRQTGRAFGRQVARNLEEVRYGE